MSDIAKGFVFTMAVISKIVFMALAVLLFFEIKSIDSAINRQTNVMLCLEMDRLGVRCELWKKETRDMTGD